CALRKIGADIIFAGRQAIDGDTAQVGPQVAQTLGLPQVTYAEEILLVGDSSIVVRRRLERGVEVVETPLPAVLTVNYSAPAVRPQNARLIMKYKHSMTSSEMRANEHSLSANLASVRDYLQIVEWSASDIECDETQLGLAGSPTKVKDVQAVVFQAKESKRLTSSDEDVKELMVELMASHTLG
ncbi:MAG: electron transfer flavoprotein beta subunit/FixA family protein, partial [Alistipes sp.]|nr:electron transfer flavoprotein beta subunit/FixA family protein [Alistipes sp.]